jgi:hypothetical protein
VRSKKKGWNGFSANVSKHTFVVMPVKKKFIPVESVDYRDLTVGQITDEFQQCTFFGCGKKLSMTEKLYGDTCFKHNGQK